MTFADVGSIYVFDANTGEQLQRKFHPNFVADSRFGESLAVLGSDVLVGAPGESVTLGVELSQAGVAYLLNGTTLDWMLRIENRIR